MIKKQFIAGAVCPQCQAMDKIQLVKISDEESLVKTHYECVACGYHKSDDDFEDASTNNPVEPGVQEVEVQTVQIMQPQKKG